MTVQKRVPLRMCLGCREMMPKNELTRVVKAPDGEVSVDLSGKKPGRGAYVCHNEECLKRIVKSNAFSRVFKTKIPDEIIQMINDK